MARVRDARDAARAAERERAKVWLCAACVYGRRNCDCLQLVPMHGFGRLPTEVMIGPWLCAACVQAWSIGWVAACCCCVAVGWWMVGSGSP